jgi:hypothetical protein
MYKTITSNQVRIWASQEQNTDFQKVWDANQYFTVKPMANAFNFDFEVKFDIFQNK